MTGAGAAWGGAGAAWGGAGATWGGAGAAPCDASQVAGALRR